MANEDLISSFMALGLSEQKAKETLKNEALTKNLVTVIECAGGKDKLTSSSTLLYHLASKIKKQCSHHIPFVAKYIITNKLDSTVRVDAALEYLLSNVKEDVDIEKFESACGVGIVVTAEDIQKAVSEAIKKNENDLLEKRYRFNTGLIMQEIRPKLKWADGKLVKNEVDKQIQSLLGPKTEQDLAPVQKVKKESAPSKKTKESAKITEDSPPPVVTISDVMKKLNFHKPGENFKSDGYVVTEKTDALLKEHLKITGGKVRTRFPPEPNGILHIGHAKAININFGYAAAHDGVCYLRYDDTNPEKEEEKFFVGIKDMVEWLGYKPYKITHSSDYFDQLYEWAVKLISKGLAYVCHQKQEEMQGFNPPPSPWRERPVEENLSLFEDMKNGKIKEGEATLRMKITLEEGKQDPVAYRIKFLSHHRTGDKWCIYPTYDFTHCLCDSIEHITHSLCTKEFQNRRSSYYWLCNALEIYCPVQWEYGRLNISNTVVSKRKIAKLIDEGIVKDWDDPRLFTLSALRRRGFPPTAINNFCAKMGVTGAQVTVDPSMIEATVRDMLNVTAPRTMVVVEPLKVTILNHKDLQIPSTIEVPDFPNEPEKGSHSIAFDSVVYIEQSDFKKEAEKGFRRLTPSQTVGLRYAGLVLTLSKCVEDNGVIKELEVTASPATAENKPKAFIHWVAKPATVEVRLYERLFLHKNPEDPNEVPAGYLSDINPESLKIVQGLADSSLVKAKHLEQFQLERVGFFCVDFDSSNDKLILNRTVSLKEDAGKV